MASFAASLRAMYSASVVDSAAVRCLRDSQLTGPPARINVKPVYDLLSVMQFAQSASTNPRSPVASFLKFIPRFGDLFR